jgi:hypothetical protein
MFMIGLYPLIFAVIAVIGSFLVFTLPQLFQAAVAAVLVSLFGRGARVGVLLALPLTVILAWYNYDYLTPTDLNLGINVGADWMPYQHGLTKQRYPTMFTIQAPTSLFSVLHCHASIHSSPKKTMIGAALRLAVLVGVIFGYGLAVEQYQFL